MDLKDHGLIVEAEVTDCVLEVFVNGIPVGLCGIGVGRTLGRPIHEFLVDGVNELAVVINPGDSPATALEPSSFPQAAWWAQPEPDPLVDAYLEAGAKEAAEKAAAAPPPPPPPPSGGGGKQRHWTALDINRDVKGLAAVPSAKFSCRIAKYPIGAVQGDGSGQTVIGLDWDAYSIFETLREEEQPFPRVVSAKSDLGAMFGPQHWQTADRLRADERTLDEARSVVEGVREAIMLGDPESVLRISTDRFREVSLAYNLSAQERANLFRRVLDTESEKLEWLFESLEPESFSLRLVAGDRMIECVQPDWSPLIRQLPNAEGRFLFPMMIGKIKGEWKIMR